MQRYKWLTSGCTSWMPKGLNLVYVEGDPHGYWVYTSVRIDEISSRLENRYKCAHPFYAIANLSTKENEYLYEIPYMTLNEIKLNELLDG